MKPSDTIRIRTTARQTKLGLIVSRELVLVRRPSNAHVLDEPLAADGAFRTAEKILNLPEARDGSYAIAGTPEKGFYLAPFWRSMRPRRNSETSMETETSMEIKTAMEPETKTTPELTPPKQSFVVEKGIPVPPDPRGRTSVYPWQSMEVGDSFFKPDTKVIIPPKHPTRKWTQRTVEENGVRGIRIWRIA